MTKKSNLLFSSTALTSAPSLFFIFTRKITHRLTKIPTFFLLIFLSLTSHSFAADDGYIHYDLDATSAHKATKYLRETFDAIVKNPSCELADPGILKLSKRQLQMMKEKFLVLDISEGDFGGYFLNIVISPKKSAHKFYTWQVWIYDISGEEKEWQLRYLKEFSVKKKDEAEFLPLFNEEKLQFWQ